MRTREYFNYGLSSFIILAMLMFVACDNTERELDNEVNEFETWVDETGQEMERGAEETWQETEQAWGETEEEYYEMVNNLEGRTAEMRDETRQRYMDTKREFEERKVEMESHINRQRGVAEIEAVVMIDSPQQEMTDVTAENLLQTYTQFVNTVDQYKDQFTAQEWNVIEQYWDMLNNRKNEVEDQISGDENAEIAELKLEYAGIKTVYKTGAKLESKEEDYE